MISLIFIVCLVSDANKCEKKEINFVETLSSMQCLLNSQIELAKWIEEHPHYFIKKVTCGKPSKEI